MTRFRLLVVAADRIPTSARMIWLDVVSQSKVTQWVGGKSISSIPIENEDPEVMKSSQSRKQVARNEPFSHAALALLIVACLQPYLLSQSPSTTPASHHTVQLLARPRTRSQPRPTAADVRQWSDRKFGMFIHFGLYSTLGGVWQGQQID